MRPISRSMTRSLARSISRSIAPPAPLRGILRRAAASPGLSLAAVVCIALGTAATSAALTLVSATLLRPLPFPDADRLVRVWLEQPGGESRLAFSYPDLLDLQERVRADGATGGSALDAVEATARARVLFQGEGGARRVEGEAVTPGYFDLLGVEPLVGRLFSPEEHTPGGPRVMLLDYRTWGERYGYDEGIVGQAVRTDEGVLTVIGVLPPSFTGSVEEDSGDIELWVPIEQYLSAERRERRDVAGIWTIGRLAPGASVDSARAELAGLGRHLATAYPEIHGGRSLTVEPLGENWRSGVRRGALLLLGASGLLLLVAAANVAVLLLARALDDRRELAIRVALGARRRRLLGSVLAEAGLLVAAGSLAGLWLGPALLRAILSQRSLVDGSLLGIPAFVELRIDPTAAALCCLTFLATALVAALGPALLGSRIDPARALQEGTRAATGGRRTRRWSNALIVTEVALTTVLVVGAALLVRSYHAMQTEDLGFRTDHVLRMALFVNEEDVPETGGLPPFYDRVRRELAAEPGVERLGVVWPTVPIDWPLQAVLTAPGLEASDPEQSEPGVRVGLYVADAPFFDVLDVPLLAGRGFRATDEPDGPPVALVSRSLALRLAGSPPSPPSGWAPATDQRPRRVGEVGRAGAVGTAGAGRRHRGDPARRDLPDRRRGRGRPLRRPARGRHPGRPLRALPALQPIAPAADVPDHRHRRPAREP